MSLPKAIGASGPTAEQLAPIRTKAQRTHLYETRNFDVEATRVHSLHECNIAYTTPERRFDAIAGLAKQLFSVPVALIGIMDGESVYFKHGWSCLGPSIDREGSFPSYVSVPTHASAIVVGDTLLDSRFATHPAVVRKTNGMRFWAGCPLLGHDGYRYGSLCLFDFVPRQFPATWLNIITNLAELTSRELERDRALNIGVVPAASEPVLMIGVHGGDWDLMYCNEGFEKLSGIDASVTGGSLWDHFELDEDSVPLAEVVQRVQSGGKGNLDLISRAEPDGESFRVTFCLAGTYRLNNAKVVGIPSFVPADEESIARGQENDTSTTSVGHMDKRLWMGVVTTKTSRQRQTQSPMSVLAARMVRSNSGSYSSDDPFLLPAVPEKLSGVTLGPLLGEGSYGKVFRGQRQQQGDEVAVKVLEMTSYNISNITDSRSEQAIAEAILSKHVSHPHIVKTFDYVMVDCGLLCHQMWIVQHLCDKGSLYDGIESGLLRESLSLDAPPSMPLLYQTALEVATAMQYLHGEGVLHGDLSGNNVLLTSADNERGWKAVVCDFGLATWAASGDGSTGGSNRPVGTISHMPPELLNSEPMTEAADVYSFGVLLWEMFCGERAWAGRHYAQIIFWVGTLGHAPKFPEGTPAELKQLGTACMALDPQNRPNFQVITQRLMNILTN